MEVRKYDRRDVDPVQIIIDLSDVADEQEAVNEYDKYTLGELIKKYNSIQKREYGNASVEKQQAHIVVLRAYIARELGLVDYRSLGYWLKDLIEAVNFIGETVKKLKKHDHSIGGVYTERARLD